MTHPSTSHPHLPLQRNTNRVIESVLAAFSHVLLRSAYFFSSNMIWRLVVLGGVYVLLLGAEGRGRGGRTVTFHRTQQDESQGQARTRPRRDISGSHRPSHGPPFTSCRIPLTPAEQKVLDDNTHEVRCVWVMCSEARTRLVNRAAAMSIK